MQSVVGSRYARALVDSVIAPGSGWKPDEVAAQLRAFEQLLADSPDLTAAMLTPAIPTSRKRAVVGKLADRLGFSRIVRNFLFVLLDHKRNAQLSEIRESFERQIDEQLGYVQADIASAEPLDQREIADLQAELTRLSGKQILPHFSVDPALLGGVVARVGSTVYDGSLRGQLEQMRRHFAQEAADYKAGI
ncbi:MAG: ATP synthase F1 subunit delta [Bryobacteraceae bacterium]